jgi:hypothetical protein
MSRELLIRPFVHKAKEIVQLQNAT